MAETSIGIIGAGAIGTAVARLAVAAGLNVILSNSRGPESLAALAAELGPKARAATAAEAAAKSDFVVISVPFHQMVKLPVAEMAGKIVIDPSNYGWQRDGHIESIDDHTFSASEYLQRQMPETRIVKLFGNLNAGQFVPLSRPSGSPDRTTLPVSSDDTNAVSQVVKLLDRLGYDALLAGSLADGWRYEPMQPAFVFPYLADKDALLNFLSTVGPDSGQPPADSGRRVTAEELQALLAQAKR